MDKVKAKIRQARTALRAFWNERDLEKKFSAFAIYGINVLITGLILWIIVALWNVPFWRFVSFGLTSAVAVYYIKWLAGVIKGEEKAED